MLYFFFVILALLWLNSSPLYGKSVGIETRCCKKLYVLLIAVVMVHSIKRWLIEIGMLKVLHYPVIAVYIIALYLMSRCSCTDYKIIRKSSHTLSLLFCTNQIFCITQTFTCSLVCVLMLPQAALPARFLNQFQPELKAFS